MTTLVAGFRDSGATSNRGGGAGASVRKARRPGPRHYFWRCCCKNLITQIDTNFPPLNPMIAKVFSVLIIATALLGQVTMRKPRAARPTPESVSLAAFLLTNCVVHEKCRPPLGGGLGPGVLGSEPRGKTCHALNDSSLLLTNYPRPAARRRWGAQTVLLPRDRSLSCRPRAMWPAACPAMLAFTTSPLPAAPRAPASARPSVRLVVARRAGRYASPLL